MYTKNKAQVPKNTHETVWIPGEEGGIFVLSLFIRMKKARDEDKKCHSRTMMSITLITEKTLKQTPDMCHLIFSSCIDFEAFSEVVYY